MEGGLSSAIERLDVAGNITELTCFKTGGCTGKIPVRMVAGNTPSETTAIPVGQCSECGKTATEAESNCFLARGYYT